MTRHRLIKYIIRLFVIWALIFLTIPAWCAPERSKAPANLIPQELKGIDIKDYYAGSGAKDVGVIQTTVGHVVVARDGMKQAYYAATGDRLYETDTIYTLKGSRCRFQLNGQDVVTMGESGRIGIKISDVNRETQSKTSVFSMMRGKAMFYALRLFKYRNASMTVETPTSVSGVRGTKWGVEVIELAGKPVASLPILVADNSPAGGFLHLAQAAPSGYQTNVYSFEGSVFVNSTITGQTVTLNAGQGVTSDGLSMGQPSSIPPAILNQFVGDTSVDGTLVPPLPPPSSPIDENTSLPFLPLDTTLITQQQNNMDQRPTTHFGYFIGQLSFYFSTSWNFSGVYANSDIQDFSSSAVTATSGSAYVTINWPAKTMTTYSDGTYFGVPTGQTIQTTELGHDAYTEWGTWTQPVIFTTMGTQNRFDTTGYYIWGDYTKTMPSSISGTYRGNSYATMISDPGTVSQSMTGTFQMDVAFTGGSGAISNFQISTTGGGKSASITNGNGTITGSAFTINSGTVSINGTAGTLTATQGSFYGASAQAVGGTWSAYSAPNYVNGIFQGKK